MAPKFRFISDFFVHSPPQKKETPGQKSGKIKISPAGDGELDFFIFLGGWGVKVKKVDLLNTPKKAITVSQFLT